MGNYCSYDLLSKDACFVHSNLFDLELEVIDHIKFCWNLEAFSFGN